MKRILIALTLTTSLLLFAQGAQASCRYYSVTQGGRTVHCSECCYGSQCYVNCY